MALDYTKKGKVKFAMINYVESMIHEDFAEKLNALILLKRQQAKAYSIKVKEGNCQQNICWSNPYNGG